VYSILVLCACAVVNLSTRWLLELYAHTPVSVNLPRWLAQTLRKRDPNQIKWYFGKFYSKSYLTKEIERIVSDITDMFKWFTEQRPVAIESETHHQSEERSEPSPKEVLPPWDDPSPPVYDQLRFSCKSSNLNFDITFLTVVVDY
jgi:hypothetical protein